MLKYTAKSFYLYIFLLDRSRYSYLRWETSSCCKMCPCTITFSNIGHLTNKSVQCDIHTICEIGKNGKQYLNIVRVCLHFVQQKYMIMITTALHTIIIITCTTYSIAEISFKSSNISSSFGKFMVNSGR